MQGSYEAPARSAKPRWVPKGSSEKRSSSASQVTGRDASQSPQAADGVDVSGSSPLASAALLVSNTCQNIRDDILPLPKPCKPVKPPSRSGRLRRRYRDKLQVWRLACGMITLVNGLHNGCLGLDRHMHK